MNQSVRVIGVTGPAAAGKDTVADAIVDVFGGLHVSAGELIRLFARYLNGMPDSAMPSREQLYGTASFIRAKINPITTIILAEEKARLGNANLLVISGLRALEEAEAIQQAGGIIIGLNADPAVRFERIKERDRDSEVWESLEQFLKQDTIENEGADNNGVNAILARADIVIENTNCTPDEMKAIIKDKLAHLLAE